MSTVTTGRPIALAQLDTELATAASLSSPPGLSMADEGTTRTVTCEHPKVTKAILQAAVDVHTPKPVADVLTLTNTAGDTWAVTIDDDGRLVTTENPGG